MCCTGNEKTELHLNPYLLPCGSGKLLLLLQFNGMLRNTLGGAVIFISLQHFIFPTLDLMLCLPSRQRRAAIIRFGGFFRSKHFFRNCGPCCLRSSTISYQDCVIDWWLLAKQYICWHIFQMYCVHLNWQ